MARMEKLQIDDYEIPLFEVEMQLDSNVYVHQLQRNLTSEEALGLALALLRATACNSTDAQTWVREYFDRTSQTVV